MMPDSPYFLAKPDPDAARRAADALFSEVVFELGRLLPRSADIRHVGATAVSGCLTKGDLDIVVRIKPDEFAEAESVLAARYARNTGSFQTDTFASFEDGKRSPHLGIQLAVMDGPEDFFHLFADALRSDPGLIDKYNALKRTFQGKPMDEYRQAKGTFVAMVLSAQCAPGR